ncbi:MAG: 3-dehydroquinate dehydratase / shikimate dehydrogenase [Acidobacteriota bacterium]|jgi:3-dehydroquinate dehydratase/shikimate dehydrogenase|nr:3-dehydroquinate dehydratase / shikimate dehydrogenase [Acidobacteriota bacterium]
MNEMNNGRICVPVCENQAIELRQAMTSAGEVADLIELRLDYLQGDELFKALRNLPALISASERPVIVTLRPAEQGGQREMDNLTRIIFWVEHFLYGKPHVDFADIELDLALLFRQREKEEGRDLLNWNRVICSHHDFTGVPSELEKIYEQMAATPARILKIAVQANEITDCLPVFHLLERARRKGREMIAVAMGNAGIATRILAPSRGAFLTYGSLDNAQSSAPGQITAAELRELYNVDKLNPQTEIMGLVSSSVSYSLSPYLHNAAFKALDVNAVYIPFEVRDAADFIRRMAHPRTRELKWKLRGLSVTMPHKSAIMEHLDWIERSASEIGAVNTIVVEGDELRGYNTDAAGLIQPLREKGVSLREARCAVIGAGGAARSALWGLGREGARVTLFARDVEKAKPVAEKFGADCMLLADTSFDGFDLVINATPLGTRGEREDQTPALSSQLRGARLAYDLVYNPPETRFLREAREAGCDSFGGLQMLVAQAAEQFRLWTGKPAPLDVMMAAALRKL